MRILFRRVFTGLVEDAGIDGGNVEEWQYVNPLRMTRHRQDRPTKPIYYTNRKGKTYYLHASATKIGKIRYVMTRAAEDALTEFPEGYAITENVNGQVSVGRIRPRSITDTEEDMVKSELETLGLNHYRHELNGACITVYEPVYKVDDLLPTLQKMGISNTSQKETLAEIVNNGPFEPVMRFWLFDEHNRVFEVQRMTYRGEGGWRSLHKFRPLKDLVRKYLKHLGKDTFYDLM